MKRLFLLVFLFPVFGTWLFGQVSYEISYFESAGNPGSLNTQMDYDVSGWTTVMQGGFMANQWSSSIPLPFSFEFYGQSVSSLYVSANGVITFSQNPGSPPGSNEALPSQALPDQSIAVFWEQFAQNPPVLSSDEIITKVFGTAPNRQFWVKWSSYQWGPSSFVYLAAVLEEGTNNIYLVDQYSNPSSASQISATVGVQENNQSAVMFGSSLPIEQVGFHYIDNHYYKLDPFVIPPEDLKPTSIVNPLGERCGMGIEGVSVNLVNNGQQGAQGYWAKLFVEGQLLTVDTLVDPLLPGDSLVHTFSSDVNFSAHGSYDLMVVVSSTSDGNLSNDTLRTIVHHIKEITQFPYQESFESGEHGWIFGGTNPSWEWATPADSVIMGAYSGVKAWVTNSLGDYNSYENSWVQSPCMNLSNFTTDLWVSFQLWWETEDTWDGVSLIASTDQGNNWIQVGSYAPGNWFNSSFIATVPGGVAQGWTGNSNQGTGSEGWKKVFTKLPVELLGESNVRFRIVFSSNSSNQYRGVAFDDFTVGRPPVFDLGSDRFFCEGDTLFVDGVEGAFSWSTGTNNPFIALSTVNAQPILDSMLVLLVTDSLGLERRDTLQFSVAPRITANVDRVGLITCFGAETGEIDLTVQQGTAPYAFTWNYPTQEEDPRNLPAGMYEVSIQDIHGCETQISEILIDQNDSMGVESNITDIRCFGDSMGEIEVIAFGGVGPYSYLWSTGDSVNHLMELKANPYDLQVVDSLGCIHTETLAVFQPEKLEAEVIQMQNAICDLSLDGRAVLNIRGGTEPYTMRAINDSLAISHPDSLGVGSYEIHVEDSAGCQTVAGMAIIESDEFPFQAGFMAQAEDSIVQLNDTSFGATIIRYDMGDGSELTTVDTSFQYTYKENGNFTITQILENPCGMDTAYATVQISGIIKTTSIGQLPGMQGIRVYPNPGEGQYHVQREEGGTEISLKIVDPQGKLIWERASKQSMIDIFLPPSTPSGIYFIQVIDGKKQSTMKLILK